jgi:hypothetical protein
MRTPQSWTKKCRWSAAAILLFAILASGAMAQDRENTEDSAKRSQENSETEATEERPTQRLDFGIDFYDAANGSVVRGGIDYNWVPLADHSFAATLPVIDSRLSDVEGSGIGDLLLRYNWVPALRLTADPWVPNNLGIGLGLLVPTGDAAKGTGGDQWVIAPSLGWAANIAKRTTLLPHLQYVKSFAEGELAQGMQTISLSVDLIHVTHSKFWVQYTPAASYDLEADEYEFDNLLVLGQQFTRRIALRLELRTLNVADPQDPAGDGREFDYRATLKLQWILAY